MKNKLIAFTALFTVLTGMVVGCADQTPNGGSAKPSPYAVSVNVHTVDLPDNRKVTCIYEGNANDGRSGGPSCDWANAK